MSKQPASRACYPPIVPYTCSNVRLSCRHLAEAIKTLDLSTLVPFPTFNGSRFRELLDEEMGYTEPTKVL